MDINTLRGVSTILVMIAFAGICWWAFSPRRKKMFEDAARLPFADDELESSPDQQTTPEQNEHEQL